MGFALLTMRLLRVVATSVVVSVGLHGVASGQSQTRDEQMQAHVRDTMAETATNIEENGCGPSITSLQFIARNGIDRAWSLSTEEIATVMRGHFVMNSGWSGKRRGDALGGLYRLKYYSDRMKYYEALAESRADWWRNADGSKVAIIFQPRSGPDVFCAGLVRGFSKAEVEEMAKRQAFR